MKIPEPCLLHTPKHLGGCTLPNSCHQHSLHTILKGGAPLSHTHQQPHTFYLTELPLSVPYLAHAALLTYPHGSGGIQKYSLPVRWMWLGGGDM